jgi:alkanesulfonate monooxygenase SsuD/methylene tetrahydromethanopterin reductase-like flavin-dependent oxidoreductase (luciferase family)
VTPAFHLFLPQMRMTHDAIVERARTAEAVGFEGMAFMDHLAPPLADDQDMWEAMSIAGWVLAHTSTLVVSHLVLCDAMRHPAVLARQVTTLDHASAGRFELGIGWGSVPVDHRGEHFTLAGAQQRPVPTRRIPITIGGTGARTLALVRAYADWWNVPLHQLHLLDARRDAAGEARVSMQQMIALVPSDADREEVTAMAVRRFGGMNPVVGTASEVAEHFAQLHARGVERFYVWFADFAPVPTIERFAHVLAGL